MLNQREIYSESFLPDDAYCLREQGYRSLPSSFYRNVLEDRSLGLLKRSYEQLPADQYGGGRYRAHSRYFLKGQEAVLDSNSSYFQSKHYNSLHGDIVRQFEPMNDLVLRSSALRRLVEKDRKLAEATRILDFKSNEIVMGLHQIRYRVKDNEVSFSSPIWLHKDDEDIVFIHLLSVSP